MTEFLRRDLGEPLGETQEDAYTIDEVQLRCRTLYLARHETRKGLHWTDAQRLYCFLCGEQCQKVRTVIGNESWAEPCGSFALDWARGTQGYARIIEEKENG